MDLKEPPQTSDIDRLATVYEGIRGVDHRTPIQLVRDLGAEINRMVLPCLASLEKRADMVSETISTVAEHAIASDIRATDATMQRFDQLEKNSKEITQEIEDIELRLSLLTARSPARIGLARALELRATELDFAARGILECSQRISQSVEQIKALIPCLENVLEKVAGVRREFQRERLKTRCWCLFADMILLVPTLIALSTTLICDRTTQGAEALTKPWLPRGYHDVVLLLFFAVQVPLLTPIVSRFSDTLSWRAFDHMLNTLRALIPELQAIELRITEAENSMAHICKGT
jgi:hypothetical protein